MMPKLADGQDAHSVSSGAAHEIRTLIAVGSLMSLLTAEAVAQAPGQPADTTLSSKHLVKIAGGRPNQSGLRGKGFADRRFRGRARCQSAHLAEGSGACDPIDPRMLLRPSWLRLQ